MPEREQNGQQLYDLLNHIFSNVNQWISHGEAKNAANLALCIAMMGTCLTGEVRSGFAVIILLLLIVSMLISLLSFWPRLGKKRYKKNLLYYGDIGDLNEKEYMEEIRKQYLGQGKELKDDYFRDLAGEILYNAGIAKRKHALFKYALIIDTVIFFLLAVFLITA